MGKKELQVFTVTYSEIHDMRAGDTFTIAGWYKPSRLERLLAKVRKLVPLYGFWYKIRRNPNDLE